MDDQTLRLKLLSFSVRVDLLIIAGAGLLLWLIVTPLSTWFLGADTATQDWVALAWTQDCWEWVTEKMVAVFLLSPLFALFGASPLWEWGLLAIAYALTLATAYELARRIGGTWQTGALAALVLIASPGFGLYARSYFGYIFPALLFGWLMVVNKRWFWAGLGFGVAFVAHFNTLVPISIAGLSILVTHIRHEKPQSWLYGALGGALLPAFTEMVFFLYMGSLSHPFTWLRGIIRVLTRFSSTNSPGNWFFLPEHLVAHNGWPLAIILMLGLITPLIVRKDRGGLALGATGLLTATFFAVQSGMGGSLVIHRSVMPSYPLWVVSAAVSAIWLLNRIRTERIRSLITTTGLILLTGHGILTSIFLHRLLPTVYPQVAQWFEQIADAGLPVKTQGTWNAALFFAQKYHIEALISDPRWLESGETDHAVLVFIGQEAPDTLDPTGYTITGYELETPLPSGYPTLHNSMSRARYAELWWPQTKAAQSVQPDTPPKEPTVALYYAGTGCSSKPSVTFEGEHVYYYQRVVRRLQRWLGLRD